MLLIKWTLVAILCVWLTPLQGQNVEEVNSKTGLYFDEVGTMLFFPTKWKIVTYINLEPTRELWKQTKTHQKRVVDLCEKIRDRKWYSYTDCIAFDQYAKSKSEYVDNLRDLIIEYLATDEETSGHRMKRGVLNFVGEISKILFGTLTQSDAKNYNKYISELDKEQQEFLHLAREQMTVVKTTITSVNSTLQRADENERILENGLSRLFNYSTHEFSEVEDEMRNINLLNEQIRLVQRGIDESEHSFEIFLEAFVHAEQGVLQPQLMTAKKVRNLVATQKLPPGLDFPNFPFAELSKIVTPKMYSYKKYLVYVLEIPLFSPTQYHLYKLLPFPAHVQKDKSTYGYISFNKEFIFSDALRQHYGKMTTNELAGCFQPNELMYVCKGEIPIYTYVPDVDCEASLLHPSTVTVPDSCEYRFLRLDNTLWIPLHLSNQWLFVAPRTETFTTLCQQETTSVKLQGEGKLTLKTGCKGYSSQVTLYAWSTITVNATSDYVPSVPVNFGNCIEDWQTETWDELPLHKPLMNVLSSADDLRMASLKVDEIQQLIQEQELKHERNLYNIVTSWWSILGTSFLLIVLVCCSCCCCKCCRNCIFWLWNKWNPKDCWRQTKDRCCVNINNYNCPEVMYTKPNKLSPAVSLKSLPELRDAASTSGMGFDSQEKSECVALRTRNKTNFR